MSVSIYNNLINKLPEDIIKLIHEYADPETTSIVTKMQYWMNKENVDFYDGIYYNNKHFTTEFYEPDVIQQMLQVINKVKLMYKRTKGFKNNCASLKSYREIYRSLMKDTKTHQFEVTCAMAVIALLIDGFEYFIDAEYKKIYFQAILKREFINLLY
jgi:hypothetical protein